MMPFGYLLILDSLGLVVSTWKRLRCRTKFYGESKMPCQSTSSAENIWSTSWCDSSTNWETNTITNSLQVGMWRGTSVESVFSFKKYDQATKEESAVEGRTIDCLFPPDVLWSLFNQAFQTEKSNLPSPWWLGCLHDSGWPCLHPLHPRSCLIFHFICHKREDEPPSLPRW